MSKISSIICSTIWLHYRNYFGHVKFVLCIFYMDISTCLYIWSCDMFASHYILILGLLKHSFIAMCFLAQLHYGIYWPRNTPGLVLLPTLCSLAAFHEQFGEWDLFNAEFYNPKAPVWEMLYGSKCHSGN